MQKLPQVTLAFWVMKICATTLGETAGDLLSMTLDVGYLVSSLVLFAAFLVTAVLQFQARRYDPVRYWLVIVSTSTAGTTISDMLDRTLQLGYPTGAAILGALLATTLVAWRWTGEPLDVSRIRSSRAELLYWTAILISNTLGTALGDFLADTSGLGFAGGTLLIGTLLTLVAIAHYTTRISKVPLFWVAFVLTRPFGAQLGDVLTKSHAKGGLDLGTVGSSAVLAAILTLLVFRTIATQRRPDPSAAP